MANFIELSYMGEDFNGYINIDKIIELTPLKDGGTKIILNITDKKGWAVWVNESIDEIMQKIESTLSKD